MSRPVDWHVLDLDRDPVPGDPFTMRSLARKLRETSEDARRAERDVRSLAGDGALLEWLGLAGAEFKAAVGEFPGQLAKVRDSYDRAADAVSSWAGELEGAQSQADRALEQGRVAREEIERARAVLQSAEWSADSASRSADRLQNPAAGAEPPDAEQVRQAVRNAQVAASRVASARGGVEAAERKLDLARRLALQAAEARDEAGDRAAREVRAAAEAGIEPTSFWDKVRSEAGKAWKILVILAKVVVAVLGIVVLIVGGPLAWVVFAAALLVLADTVMKWVQGQASAMDLVWALLDCIPGTKGITTFARLRAAGRTGGMLGAARHVGAAARAEMVASVNGAIALWKGRRAIPFLVRNAPRTALSTLTQQANVLRAGLVGAVEASGLAVRAGALGAVLDFARMGYKFGQVRYASEVAVGLHPAQLVRGWQGSDAFPGIDIWRDTVVPAGTLMEAGAPGLKNFTTDAGSAARSGNDAPGFFEGVQVGPNRGGGYPDYRAGFITLKVKEDLLAAEGVAKANSQYGAGGTHQYFFPALLQDLEAGRIVAMKPDGTEIRIGLSADGLKAELPDGVLINLKRNHGYVKQGILQQKNFLTVATSVEASAAAVRTTARHVYDVSRTDERFGNVRAEIRESSA